MTARRLLAVLPVVLLAAGPGCGGDDAGGAATRLAPGDAIGMKARAFTPEKVEVAAGQTVTWENTSSVPHDVKATGGADFASDAFGKGGRFSWKAAKAGTVTYECTLHPGMDGTIAVRG